MLLTHLQEAKQLQALKSLMALPGSAEGANQLGSGWAIVLRTLSALDALGSELKLPQVGQGFHETQ